MHHEVETEHRRENWYKLVMVNKQSGTTDFCHHGGELSIDAQRLLILQQTSSSQK
jgi:hypothetical protein